MDSMTREQRSYVMSRIRSSDTKAEVRLRKALWHRGLRYRKNYRKLPGTPDIALTRKKIAIFVDGDFWHGKGYEDAPGKQIKTNRTYWKSKLSRNIERDKDVNDALLQEGWLVLRFWESDIQRDLEACVEEILRYIK